jgi:hypothetical protein
LDAYASEKLGKFGLNFRFSKFAAFIDSINQSFTSTQADLRIQKRFEPILGQVGVYTIKFNFDNEIYHPVDGYPPVVSSSGFGYYDPSTQTEVDSFLDDDGYGNIRIYKKLGEEKIFLNENAGTVNYQTGTLSLLDFNPTYILPSTNTEIQITVVPISKDIFTRRNQIILFDKENSVVSVVPDSFRTERSQTATSFPSNR